MPTAHILIADDEPIILKLLLQMLESALTDTQVDTVDSAEAALARLAATDYDVIVSDIKMHGMDGLALLDLIRERWPDLPVILLTAYEDQHLVVLALRAGAYDFIQKPVAADYFVASLGRAIATHQLRRRVAAQQAALAAHADELEATVQARLRELLVADAAKNESLRARDQALAAAEAAHQRLAFLAEAGTLLAASLDYETTLRTLAHLAVPRLADWCLFYMVHADGRITWIAGAPRDAEKAALIQDLAGRTPLDSYRAFPGSEVLETGQPCMFSDISAAQLAIATQDPQHLVLLRALGIASFMCVPLAIHGRMLGAMALLAGEAGRRFGADDLALATDLAGRAALAIENARLYDTAGRALQVRDSFLTIATHELKTPATAMLAAVQALQQRSEGTLDPRDRRPLSILADQTRRLHRLITSLFDLSRLQTGQFTIDKAPIDLGALVRRVVEELVPVVDTHTIDYYESVTPLIINGDELRLEQVLQNLIGNAIKYSPDGGTIRVRVVPRDGQACIAVTDTGIGIPAAALEQLFTRFYRAENVNRRHIAGMGLGLYVVKEITTLHGGTVSVTSAEGRGSTFTVCLPLEE